MMSIFADRLRDALVAPAMMHDSVNHLITCTLGIRCMHIHRHNRPSYCWMLLDVKCVTNNDMRVTLYFFEKHLHIRTVKKTAFTCIIDDSLRLGEMILHSLRNPAEWEDCTGPAFRIYNRLVKRRDAKKRAMVLALAMGLHSHLGAASPMRELTSDHVQMIAEFL